MTLAATDFDFRNEHSAGPAPKGPSIDKTHWGYSVRQRDAGGAVRVFGAAASRFFGTIMLLIAAGLLLIPDSAQGAGVDAMKLAAMVVFTGIGLYLFIFGRQAIHPELHIDTTRGEIRIGRRGMKGDFRANTTLPFEHVASVYLLRTKDRGQPTRLYLRLVDTEVAIEVACGDEAALDALRAKLAQDLAHDPREPVALQLSRHAQLAA